MPNSRAWNLLFACQALVCPVLAGDLVDAAKDNDYERLVQLVESDRDVNDRGERDVTALHWVASDGDLETARFLIDAGARVDARMAGGSTPLHLAAYKGHLEMVRLLLDSGADAHAQTRDGVTPLDWAKHKGHQSTIALLGSVPRRVMPSPAGRTAPSPPPNGADDRPAAPSPVVMPNYRIQLIALGSERRALEAAAKYDSRYADILGDLALSVEAVDGTERPVYRVQSEPVSFARARAICGELRRRDQDCMVRALDDL